MARTRSTARPAAAATSCRAASAPCWRCTAATRMRAVGAARDVDRRGRREPAEHHRHRLPGRRQRRAQHAAAADRPGPLDLRGGPAAARGSRRARRWRCPATPTSAGTRSWRSLKTLFDEAKVGAYLGVDYPNPDYSHFQSRLLLAHRAARERRHDRLAGQLAGRLRLGHQPAPGRRRAVGRRRPAAARAARRPPPSTRRPTSRSGRTASGIRTGSSARTGGTAGPARSKARKRAMDVVRQSVYVNHALKPLAGTRSAADAGRRIRTRAPASRCATSPACSAPGLGIRVATVQADGALRQPREPARLARATTSPTWATRCSRSSATSRLAGWPTAC